MRSRSMFDKPKKLGIFSESGPLVALAVAAAMLLGLAGPSSAQLLRGYQQRPQPQRGGAGSVAAGAVEAGAAAAGGWRRLVWQRQFWPVPAAGAAASFRAAAASGAARARGFFEGAATRETRNRTSAAFSCSAMPWRTGSPMVLKTPMPNSPTWA